MRGNVLGGFQKLVHWGQMAEVFQWFFGGFGRGFAADGGPFGSGGGGFAKRGMLGGCHNEVQVK